MKPRTPRARPARTPSDYVYVARIEFENWSTQTTVARTPAGAKAAIVREARRQGRTSRDYIDALEYLYSDDAKKPASVIDITRYVVRA